MVAPTRERQDPVGSAAATRSFRSVPFNSAPRVATRGRTAEARTSVGVWPTGSAPGGAGGGVQVAGSSARALSPVAVTLPHGEPRRCHIARTEAVGPVAVG